MIKVIANILKADTVDRKGMIIPKSVLEEAVADFNRNLEGNKIVGDLSHPEPGTIVAAEKKIELKDTDLWAKIEHDLPFITQKEAMDDIGPKEINKAAMEAFRNSLVADMAIKPADK